MNIANYNERIEKIATQYNERLAALQLESLPVHEYGLRWNEEQHNLLDMIKAETEYFMKENNCSVSDFQELGIAGRKILADHKILITVPVQ